MKDSQRNVDSYGDKVKYIKANNERFSTIMTGFIGTP